MKSAAVRKTRARPGRATKPANPEPSREQACRQLEGQMLTERLEPGESLSESTRAGGLRIGCTPIREALQLLACEVLDDIETFTRATVAP